MRALYIAAGALASPFIALGAVALLWHVLMVQVAAPLQAALNATIAAL